MKNNMVFSAEVRWFFEGDWPNTIKNWFGNTQGEVKFEEVRVDKYLIFPACDSVGVKLRDGKKFEVKSLIAAPRPFVGEGFNGRTDCWVKWSFEESEKDPAKQHLPKVAEAMLAGDQWISVEKTRMLRKFSATNGDQQPVDPNSHSDCGCNIELTRLQVEATKTIWFTLGFEAFGPLARVAQVLDEATPLFFQQRGALPCRELSGLASCSYPAWLATLEVFAPIDAGNSLSNEATA